jgi:hypothetical protein
VLWIQVEKLLVWKDIDVWTPYAQSLVQLLYYLMLKGTWNSRWSWYAEVNGACSEGPFTEIVKLIVSERNSCFCGAQWDWCWCLWIQFFKMNLWLDISCADSSPSVPVKPLRSNSVTYFVVTAVAMLWSRKNRSNWYQVFKFAQCSWSRVLCYNHGSFGSKWV